MGRSGKVGFTSRADHRSDHRARHHRRDRRARARRDHPVEACGLVVGPAGSERPCGTSRWTTPRVPKTFYRLRPGRAVPGLGRDGRPGRGAGGHLPLAHRDRGEAARRDGCADRYLRLRGRWPDGGVGHSRPVAAEQIIHLGDTAHVPYGPQPIAVVRRYALECLDRLVDERREAADDRLQLGLGGLPARRPGALPRPGGRGDPSRGAACGGRDPQWAGGYDRYGRHDHQPARTRTPSRRRPSRGHQRGMPAVRGLRGARNHHRADDARARQRLPGAAATGRCRHPGAGLHPLPAAGRGDRAGDGRRGDAGVQRRRDRQGRLPDPHRAGSAASRRRRCGGPPGPGPPGPGPSRAGPPRVGPVSTAGHGGRPPASWRPATRAPFARLASRFDRPAGRSGRRRCRRGRWESAY